MNGLSSRRSAAPASGDAHALETAPAELREAEREREAAVRRFEQHRGSVDTAGELALYAAIEAASQRVRRLAAKLERSTQREPRRADG